MLATLLKLAVLCSLYCTYLWFLVTTINKGLQLLVRCYAFPLYQNWTTKRFLLFDWWSFSVLHTRVWRFQRIVVYHIHRYKHNHPVTFSFVSDVFEVFYFPLISYATKVWLPFICAYKNLVAAYNSSYCMA